MPLELHQSSSRALVSWWSGCGYRFTAFDPCHQQGKHYPQAHKKHKEAVSQSDNHPSLPFNEQLPALVTQLNASIWEAIDRRWPSLQAQEQPTPIPDPIKTPRQSPCRRIFFFQVEESGRFFQHLPQRFWGQCWCGFGDLTEEFNCFGGRVWVSSIARGEVSHLPGNFWSAV